MKDEGARKAPRDRPALHSPFGSLRVGFSVGWLTKHRHRNTNADDGSSPESCCWCWAPLAGGTGREGIQHGRDCNPDSHPGMNFPLRICSRGALRKG
jgi:hypothetical protein